MKSMGRKSHTRGITVNPHQRKRERVSEGNTTSTNIAERKGIGSAQEVTKI